LDQNITVRQGHPVRSRCVWKGADLRNDSSWVWMIPPEGLADIDAALAQVERRGLRLPRLDKSDFPLPRIAGELARLAEEVDNGRGFQLLRGLPVKRYSYEQLRTIFWGVGLHFGRPAEQTKDGDWLIDVRDEGGSLGQNQRGYHSPVTLDFHTDGANTVALLCIEKAMEGGVSVLANSAAIHNALLEKNPDYLVPLYEGFPVDRRGAEPEGEPRVSPWKLPVFSFTNGRLNCVYDRRSSQWGRERIGQPLTETEKAAFDAFDALAHDPEFRLDMELQPGDMQFVNNFSVLHSRTSFVDNPDEGKKRHLLRLWLEVPGSRQQAINKLHLYTRTPVPGEIRIRPST
jgi:hypothetical protein